MYYVMYVNKRVELAQRGIAPERKCMYDFYYDSDYYKLLLLSLLLF